MNKAETAQKIAASTLIIIIMTLSSKVLGFIREILIASKFGSGIETDSYFVALMLTGLISGLIGAAMSTTLIPILFKVEVERYKLGKVRYVNNLINIVTLLSFVLVLIGWLLTPILIRRLAPGFEGEQFHLAVKLSRLGLPSLIFIGIERIFSGYLHSENKFTLSAAVGIPYNLTYIVFLLFFQDKFGIVGLTVTSVVAFASQLFIQKIDLNKINYQYEFVINIKDRYLYDAMALAVPTYIATASNQINTIIDRSLASNLPSGSISSLNYANRLNELILSVFIVAISTVLFPILAKESSEGNLSEMKKIMGHGINVILLITIPASAGIIILGKPIVEVAFQRGVFDSTATIMTTQALIFYSVGIVATALRLFLNKVFYSLHDTKTPMINGIIGVTFNIILNLILVRYKAHSGLALATSLASIISTAVLFYNLKNKIGSIGAKGHLKCGLKSGLSAIIMAVVVYNIYHSLYGILDKGIVNNLISLTIAIGGGALLYFVVCYILGVDEMRMVVCEIKEKLKMRR